MSQTPRHPAATPGIDILCSAQTDRLRGRRVGLVSHAAALSTTGVTSAELVAGVNGCQLVSLLGPEHGFFGTAGAGETCTEAQHPVLHVPVHSLYGTQRKPTPAMLEGLDLLVVDMQDLSLRCYTYVSTLALVLEAAMEAELEVIVTDRPTPFATRVAGPMLDDACRSFVGQIDAPFMYGMTPAETARWMKATSLDQLRLDVVACNTHGRSIAEAFFDRWPSPPPSPALATRESILCYPITVFLEAFGNISHGRGTPQPFQTVVAPWLDGVALASQLRSTNLPGIDWFAHPMQLVGSQEPVAGLRLLVTDEKAYDPIRTALHLLQAIHTQNPEQFWHADHARPAFLDKLAGTPDLRNAITDGREAKELTEQWRKQSTVFQAKRKQALLYQREGAE